MSKHSLPFVVLAAALSYPALPVYAQGKPVNLPDGPGKESVIAHCSGCHGLARVANSGYPQAYWHTTVRMMMNFGVPIPQDQVIPMIDYLAKSFPEKPMPVAKIVPGPTQVNIREWQVPTPGSRPHDPLAARDGSIWYTGQLSNKLGRVDPKTGQIREYPLKTPQTAPHGLVEDKDGNIWFTGNHTSVIGKLDPKTLAVREYTLPDPKSRPRRMAITGDDMIWYADYSRGYLGRLDPATAQVTEWPSPSGPRSLPYGIVAAKGAIWYNESGVKPNTIVRFDPQTEQFQSWLIPSGGYIVRKMDVTPDGNPVMVNSTVNFVGMIDVR